MKRGRVAVMNVDPLYSLHFSLSGMCSLLPSLKFFSHEAVSLCWFARLAQACLTDQMPSLPAKLYIGSLCYTWRVYSCLYHTKKPHIIYIHDEEACPCSLSLFNLSHLWFPPLFWLVADPGKSVMSARFRLPAGRSYNVRATELERDRQHTQVVCNVLLLDNTVQAFKVNVSTRLSCTNLNEGLQVSPLISLVCL